jgi:chemotaxis protein methyltransferase CheR
MSEKLREFEYTFDDFNVLRQMSNQHSGILVPDDKFDMFYSRLAKRVRLLGFTTVKQYCQYLQQHPDQEFTEFINSVTTNLTSFFREKHHFDYLAKTVIPELLKSKHHERQIKIWSAGCSTGEEPYTLAITLLEHVPESWNIKILATDLDTNVLATAAQGVYPWDRVSSLPNETINRWFQRGTGSQANNVRVKNQLKQLIHFNQLNLMKEWPMTGCFDFIFCRNVLIYFDKETKEGLANRFAKLLRDGGHLFIGHSESLHQLDTPFKLIGNTVYKKTPQ